MAILKQVWNAVLGSPDEPDAYELSVVREDRNSEILFSVVEAKGAVRRRTTFSLNPAQAMGLARFLAGVRTLEASEDDEEHTPTGPTKPGHGP